MKLVIGGYAQGKLNYVLQKYKGEIGGVWDGEVPRNGGGEKGVVVINRLHDWIKGSMAEGGCPEEEIFAFLENCPNCVMISDEIGNGIVPIEAFEREYRERTGRILIALAKKADTVERVICGIGQKIK